MCIILFERNTGCSGNKSMTLFSLLEDKIGPGVVNSPQEGEHSTAYLTSISSYSIQLCNYYTIIYTMLLLRSLKDNYKKITLPSIFVLMV